MRPLNYFSRMVCNKTEIRGYIKASFRLDKDSKGIFKEVCVVYGNKYMSLRQVLGGSANSTMANLT